MHTQYSPAGFQSLAFLLGGNTVVRIHGQWRWWRQMDAQNPTGMPIQQFPSQAGIIVTQGPDAAPEPPSATQGTADWLHWRQLVFRMERGWSGSGATGELGTSIQYAPGEPHDRLDIEANRRITDGNFGRVWMCWDNTAPFDQPPPYIQAEWWFRILVLV